MFNVIPSLSEEILASRPTFSAFWSMCLGNQCSKTVIYPKQTTYFVVALCTKHTLNQTKQKENQKQNTKPQRFVTLKAMQDTRQESIEEQTNSKASANRKYDC